MPRPGGWQHPDPRGPPGRPRTGILLQVVTPWRLPWPARRDASCSAACGRQRLLDHRGHLLADIDLHQLWGSVGPCLALPRTELHQILREGVPVQLGRTIRSLENLDRPVQVGFDDGSGTDSDLVVGADGLRSSVRRLAVDPRPPVPVGQHSWRFLPACPPEVTTWTVMLGRGTSFLTVPVGQGLVYAYADVTADSEPVGDPIGRLRQRFAGFAAPVPELLRQLDDPSRVHVAPIEQVAATGRGRGAVAAFVTRRSWRTGWVRSQTYRRHRTRNLPPVLRDLTLRAFGRRIFQSNYRPLLDPIQRLRCRVHGPGPGSCSVRVDPRLRRAGLRN
jgi:FAD-dependent urate hydroxylase